MGRPALVYLFGAVVHSLLLSYRHLTQGIWVVSLRRCKIFVVPMKAQSHLCLWQFGSYLRYGMLSSCICSTLVSVCAMKGIYIRPLAQWGKDLTCYLSPFFCLVNWDMHYPGTAYRGTDLPLGRLLYIHIHLRWIFIDTLIYSGVHKISFPLVPHLENHLLREVTVCTWQSNDVTWRMH